MQELDLAINHGVIVNADHRLNANIGIKNGVIVEINSQPLSAKKTINAANKWVIPGVVDTHVHFALQQGQGEDGCLTQGARSGCRWRGDGLHFENAILEENSGTP